jgi:hypothetical protein
LAYIRTSITVAMQGVLIAQLFRLQSTTADHGRLSYYTVGIPLAVACHVIAILIALMGAHRFWRQQSAVAHGKVNAGGWQLNWIGIFIGLVGMLPSLQGESRLMDTGESGDLHTLARYCDRDIAQQSRMKGYVCRTVDFIEADRLHPGSTQRLDTLIPRTGLLVLI